MTAPTIHGNLDEMLDRARKSRIQNEEEENKLSELILLRNDIILELEKKYHFDRMYLSIEKFNEILPYLIKYINNPNSEPKESLIQKINEFIRCYRDG